MSSDHYSERRFTDKPVQSGTSLTDNSYQLADRVILEVLFSDTMASYKNGQYSVGGLSKSIAAYQLFDRVMRTGQPVKLATRLKNYDTMGIESVRASDSILTSAGCKFTMVLKQIILAQISTTKVQSARPDQTQSTSTGVQSTPVPPTVTNNFTVPPLSAPAPFPSAPVNPDPNPLWNSNPVGAGGGMSSGSIQ